MSNYKRRALKFTFGAVGALLVPMSAAYACTAFKGTMTVTGNAATPGSVSATGDGSSMRYCSGPTGTANVKANTSGTVSVTIGPATGSCTGKLTSGTYELREVAGTWNPSTQSGSDCMAPTGGTWPGMKTISVDGNGNSSATATGSFTPGAAGGSISICVSDTLGNTGNQVPLSIVTM